MKKTIKIILIIIVCLIIILFFLRFLNPREIDDVNPLRNCENKYLEKSKILWVIPLYDNQSISENQKWCNKIKSLNKTIEMHGVYHQPYREFNQDRNKEYLEKGIQKFEKCFGFKPKMFKAPNLYITKNNKKLIKQNKLKLKHRLNQWTHKVYHCNDSGRFSNKFIDFF